MIDSRIKPPDNVINTVRDRIVLYIKSLYEAAVFNLADPNSPKLFDVVGRGTLDDIDVNQTPGCMIEEGSESQNVEFYGTTDETLRLYVNFKIVKGSDVDVYSTLNYYIGRVRQVLIRPDVDNLQLADLTLGVSEAGNSIQYNGASDPEPGGTVMFNIEYRHQLGQPFMEFTE